MNSDSLRVADFGRVERERPRSRGRRDYHIIQKDTLTDRPPESAGPATARDLFLRLVGRQELHQPTRCDSLVNHWPFISLTDWAHEELENRQHAFFALGCRHNNQVGPVLRDF